MAGKQWILMLVGAAAVVGLTVACGGGGSTAPITTVKTDDGKVSFNGTVLPILKDHCRRCHAEKRKGNLYLMTYDGVMKGGNRGAIVVPGDPDGSLIIGSVTKTREPHMPPKVFPALTPDRVEAIRTWISEGATNN